MLMSFLTPGLEIKGLKRGFFLFSSHKINNLLTIFSFNIKTSHTNISTLSFLKLFFLENLKLTKNNYLQTKLELLLYSILSLI